MPSPTGEFDAGIATLRANYIRRLPGEFARLRHAAGEVRRSRGQRASLEALHRVAHALAGSGATFGFRTLSLRARDLAERCWTALQREETVEIADVDAFEVAIALLEEAAKEPSTAEPGHGVARLPAQGADARRVLIIDADPARAADLAVQLGAAGFRVRAIDDAAALDGELAGSTPLAIVADLDLATEVGKLGKGAGVPVLFVSGQGDLPQRLQALRAGAAGYFARPVNITALVDALEAQVADAHPQPMRVLIVEDDELVAELYARILRLAGMTVAAVTDPMAVMAPLAELRPDVIVMDMYMDGCNGSELAAVIRQEPAWANVPILYVSAERHRARQLDAMRRGGDDFLVKPIDSARLVTEVTARGTRMRKLRAQLANDGLTGLLNTMAIRSELEREVARAHRERAALSAAMIDLDNFKSVNDTHGHPVGDRVLKNLAHLLRRRLRKSDLVGRYGGEELLVILPSTPGEAAATTIDRLRAAFSQVPHETMRGELYVTFTAGVAAFPAVREAAALVEAADRALYAGKRAGRDRVTLGVPAAS